MPVRFGLSRRPAFTAWSASLFSVEASGSSVIWMDFQAGSRTAAGSALPESASSCLFAEAFASSGLALIHLLVSTEPLRTASTTFGCSSRNFCDTMMFVITNFLSGHRSDSSSSTLPPSATSLDAVGSGTQAPSMEPDL